MAPYVRTAYAGAVIALPERRYAYAARGAIAADGARGGAGGTAWRPPATKERRGTRIGTCGARPDRFRTRTRRLCLVIRRFRSVLPARVGDVEKVVAVQPVDAPGGQAIGQGADAGLDGVGQDGCTSITA